MIPGFMRSLCAHTNATLQPVSGSIYAFALDAKPVPTPMAGVLFGISAAGTGSQVGELAVCTSATQPLGSLGASLNITPQVVANLSTAGLNSTGSKNITLSYTIPANTQAWLAIRLAFGTAQPTFVGGVGCNGGTNVVRILAAGGVMSVGNAKSMPVIANGRAIGPGLCFRTS